MTSHDVVYFIRRLTGIKKCGHTGTLDPGAAGVLPVCLGKATRLTRFVTEGDKTYRAELTLGVATTSLDAFGEILEEQDASRISPEQLLGVLPLFTGKIYQLERAGQKVEVPSRMITIHDLRFIAGWHWQKPHPRILLDVTCSKGTYVRSLCSDIGKALGCSAYMSFLLRSRVGAFTLEKSFTLEQLNLLAENNRLEEALLPMEQAVSNLPVIEIHATALKPIVSGSTLFPAGVKKISRAIQEQEMVQVQHNGRLLGIYKAVLDQQEQGLRQIFKPETVLSSD